VGPNDMSRRLGPQVCFFLYSFFLLMDMYRFSTTYTALQGEEEMMMEVGPNNMSRRLGPQVYFDLSLFSN